MNIKLHWKVAPKPEIAVRKAAGYYTFKTCTAKCGE